MVVMILPKFVSELEEKLDEVIKDIAIKNKIDLFAIKDSKAVEDGKSMISNTLIRLYWHYRVEERKELEKFEQEMKEEKNRNV
jgi:hypothetical protein